MRVALIVVLSLAISGCALWRKDQEEPVDNTGPRREKAEPVLKPSEALKPKSLEIASPITDHFYMNGIYFQPTADTQLRLNPTVTTAIQGTLLDAEDDLGLDEQINQARMEFDIRMVKNHHMRLDYFKLDRFGQVPLANPIVFGNLIYLADTNLRTKIDWRTLTLTYTYSFIHFERVEAGMGLGVHIIEGHVSTEAVGFPATLQKIDSVGIFPTIAINGAYRISKRWSVTARGQQFSASPEDFDGKLADYHADVQYRWRKNFAVGLGYTKLVTELEIFSEATPLLFNLDTSGPELFFRASF